MRAVSLPDVDEVLAAASVVAIPMRVRFRGVDVREAVILRGPAGWGEFSPFVEYDDAEASRWLAAGLEAAWGPAAGAVGAAADNEAAEDAAVPVRRELVPVNATVPAVAPEQVEAVIARFDGCTTAKVKVAERGQRLEDDVARVAQVRAIMGPAAQVRIDANGGWSLDDAAHALGRLSTYALEYAEQPCATVEELAQLRIRLARNGIDVPIAADESVRKAEDPLRVARAGAADLIVVKVAPLGGVARALQIVHECGLPAVVSSALDTSVGIAAGVRLAAALPELPFACGLGTVSLLAGDVSAWPLRPVGGALARAAADAVSLPVSGELLARWAAPADRDRWWRERLRRAHAQLAG